jgi:hypothetical protein
MTLMKDLAWMVLILLLMPVIMAVAFVAVAIILLRSLYRWARGNTTSTSRAAQDAPRPDWWASLSSSIRRQTPAGPAPLAIPVLVPSYATSRRRRP